MSEQLFLVQVSPSLDSSSDLLRLFFPFFPRPLPPPNRMIASFKGQPLPPAHVLIILLIVIVIVIILFRERMAGRRLRPTAFTARHYAES